MAIKDNSQAGGCRLFFRGFFFVLILGMLILVSVPSLRDPLLSIRLPAGPAIAPLVPTAIPSPVPPTAEQVVAQSTTPPDTSPMPAISSVTGVTSIQQVAPDILHAVIQQGYLNSDTANAIRLAYNVEGTVLVQLDDGIERVRFYYRNGTWQRIDTIVLGSPTPSPYPPGTTFYTRVMADGRSCPRLDCEVRTYIPPGVGVQVAGMTSGDSIQGNNQWYIAIYTDREIYLHTAQMLPYHATPLAEPRPFSSSASSGSSCPSNCAGAVARGMSARAAAACGLDRDGDGVACYGD